MSLFADRVRSDPVHQELAGFKELVESTKVGSPEPTAGAIARLERLVAISERFTSAANLADPLLVPLTALGSARNAIANATNEVNNYRANRNEGHLDNAGAHLESLITAAAMMEAPRTSPGLQRLSQSIARARTAANEAAQAAEGRTQALAERLNVADARAQELAAEIERQLPALNAELTQQQQNFRAQQNSWNDTLREATQSQADRVNQFLIETTNNLNSAATAQQTKLQELLEEARGGLREISTTYESEAQAVIETMHGFRDEASKLLEIVGVSGVIGGYKQEADRSRKAAFRSHAGALILLVVLAALAWIVLFPATRGEGWPHFAARALLFAVLAAPATYLARQAIRYDRTERANRRLELELSSVRPFIADLDQETQKEVKLKLVDRLYAQPEPRENVAIPTAPSADALRTLAAQLLELAGKRKV